MLGWARWLGTFGNPGNGLYCNELQRARTVIAAYASATALPLSQVVVRLDGLYGNAAPLADLLKADGPGVVVRGKAYHLLEQTYLGKEEYQLLLSSLTVSK